MLRESNFVKCAVRLWSGLVLGAFIIVTCAVIVLLVNFFVTGRLD